MNTIKTGTGNETGTTYTPRTVEKKDETNVQARGDSVEFGQDGDNEVASLKKEIAELRAQMKESKSQSTSGDYLARGKEYAKNVGQTVKEGAESASGKCEEFVSENPKMASLITAGFGLLAGVAIEKTDVMGKTRDKVKGAVSSTKSNFKDLSGKLPGKGSIVSTVVKEGLRLGTTAVVVDAVVKRRMEKMKTA